MKKMKKGAIFNEALKMAYEIKKRLDWIPDTTNGGMEFIVYFFMVTSPYYDKGRSLVEEGKKFFFFSKREKDKKRYLFLLEFSKFLRNTGRCEWGWNRTVKEETPSIYSTYICPGISYEEDFNTLNVAEYLRIKNSPNKLDNDILKDSARGKYNLYEFVEREFVTPFMKKNYDHLVKILDDYEK